MAFVPINSYHIIIDTNLSAEEIEKQLLKVKKLLYEGDVQNARILLNTLRSEIDIVIEQLPLATYPDAIKLASKYIIDGNIEEAQKVLSVALNSMVVETVVIPLPIVKATYLIKAASEITETDKDKALEYLKEAKEQLKIAKVLGYGKNNAKTYKDLRQRIETIERKIKGKNKTEGLFEELIKKIEEFKTKLREIRS